MTSDSITLSNGEKIPISFVTRRDARSIIIHPKTMPTREISVTLPRITSVAAGRRFVDEKRKWIERIFDRAPVKTKLKDGDIITIFGADVLIRHDPKGKTGIYKDDGRCKMEEELPSSIVHRPSYIMVVCGGPEFLERRVRDEVKTQFLKAVKKEIQKTPAAFHPAKVAVHDTSTRWGSCSSSGTISFSWRLAFAPPEVMRYVILHELSHRKYMDHSPKFWRQVTELYGPGVERAKLWLSKNGQELHKYF